MTIITPTGITGITSITSTGNTLQFRNPSGADVSVSGLNVTSGTNINVTGIVTASGFVGNVTGNINSTGVSTFTSLSVTGQSTLTNANVSGVSTSSRLNVGTGGTVITTTGNGLVGIGVTNPSQALDVNGYVRANRFTVPYSQVVTTYKTNNPSTNVIIEGTPNDRDFWLFRDPADSNTNWGIYYRNIDSTLSESGEYSVPGNSISFVGGGTASPGVTIDLANGDLQVKRNIKIGNNNIIQWVEVSPGATEWSWNAQVTSQAITLNPSTIPSTARYVLADVFVTANSSDHHNVVLGRDVLTNQKNWVDTRGQQPSGQFGTLTRQAVTLTYNGETDGYTPNFGMWYSSQHIPCSGRTIYYNNFGWSGSSGWVYVVVKAFSL